MRTRTFISSAGVRLTGDVGGNPAATSVVLLHGGGQTRHSWGRAARELIAHGYHAASIDLRGHGDSEWAADGDYGLDNQAADIRAVISELPTAPVLIGASMGGLVALTVTGESAPQLVKGLILVDVTPRVDDDGREKIRDFMRARGDGFASIDEAADAISRYQPNRPRPSDLSGLSRNLRLRGDGRWVLALGSEIPRDLRNRSRPVGPALRSSSQERIGSCHAREGREERTRQTRARPTFPAIDSACGIRRRFGRRAHDSGRQE